LRDEQVPVQRTPVDFGAAVAEAAAMNRPAAASKKIEMVLQELPDRVIVMADEEALRQALDNLVSNAVKFTPVGGSVRISVLPPHLGYAQCRVEDSGPGFTEDDRSKLFRRYQRLSARPTANEPSTGLGLSIAWRLLDHMRGELRLEDSPSPLGGACFVVRVPLAVTPRETD
jgi:two-component system sensor histidine kinase/response regulator